MTRRSIHRILLVLLVLAAGIAAGAWWYAVDGKYPLAGDRSHDFGDVPITGRTASVSHTFTLRNRRGQPVIIETVRPGCGCTDATPSTREVAPGETVDIDVTLTLSRAGKKDTTVALVIKDFGVENLWVRGVGRKELEVATTSEMIHVPLGMPSPFSVEAYVQTEAGAQPDTPIVTAPPAVEVRFIGWEAGGDADAKTAKPARWRGRFTIELPADWALDREMITVKVPGAEPVKLRVVAVR